METFIILLNLVCKFYFEQCNDKLEFSQFLNFEHHVFAILVNNI